MAALNFNACLSDTINHDGAKMTGCHWRASILLSRALCGPRGRPLCSRVYAAKPSRGRAVFMFATDILFAEYRHCRNVHERWAKTITAA